MFCGKRPSAYASRPLAPLGRRLNPTFSERKATGATVSDSGPYRAANPTWTAVVIPRPAQSAPSFQPYGNVELKRKATEGRTTSKVQRECLAVQSYRPAHGWAPANGSNASSSAA